MGRGDKPFPDMFDAITTQGVTGRAVKNGLIDFNCWNPRDYATDKHRTVDDRPYGGGPGMLMMVEPLKQAILDAKSGRRWCKSNLYVPARAN